MNEINALCHELILYSTEWYQDEISKEELNLKMDLLLSRIDKIEINYRQPLDISSVKAKDSFNSLLVKTKYKATASINTLIATSNKKTYKAKVNFLLKNQLYFGSLHRTMRNNINAYVLRNQLSYWNPNVEIFKLGGNENE
ncbi:hypothetical protein ACIQXV_24540 [Neobacillus sp. NPDC097160]|uniref:hypothetical protein n=1 Tax=Neobacillus sp. NPDC097160 TaxID=3364298 RepID=UPI0038011691